MHRIPTLPTGAPGVRLRHLVMHYYAFGPRAMLDLFERLVDGRLPDAMAVVEELEHGARIDPALVKAIGGYEFELRVFDLTQTFRARLPSEEPPSDARRHDSPGRPFRHRRRARRRSQQWPSPRAGARP